MNRHRYIIAPILPLAVILIAAILVLFPPGQSAPHLPFVGQAVENMQQFRTRLLQEYREAGLNDETYAIVSAMTLGDKSALTRELRDTYNKTGASHILALSGLHLGIIYMLLTCLVPGRRWRMASQVVTILAMWAFAFLTGLSPSITRAATMLTVYGLLSLGYREKMSVNVLAFTAILMLLVSPQSLYSISFQMSFMAVLGILLFMPLFYELIPVHVLQRHTLLKWPWGLVCVSTAAQLGVAPLIAFYFHRLSVWFFLSNFVVIPCAYIILLGSIVLLITRWPIASVLITFTVTQMNRALSEIASLPLSSVDNLHPNIIQIVLIYVVIACVWVFFSTFVGNLKRY